MTFVDVHIFLRGTDINELHWSLYFIIYLLCLFLAVLGLRFCVRAFSSCGEWGPLFIAVRGPVTIAASLVAEHRLQRRRLSSCGSRAQLPRGMWIPPRPELEPVSPALAGRLSTSAPPGKPLFCSILKEVPFPRLLGPSGVHHFPSRIPECLQTPVGLLSNIEAQR